MTTPTPFTRGLEHIGIVGTNPQAVALGALLSSAGAKVVVVAPDEIAAVRACHLVVEATGEDATVKATVLSAICSVVDKAAIVAVSSQALPVTQLASGVLAPSRVLGLRLTRLGPRAQGLLEVTRTVLTDPGVLAAVEALVSDLDVISLTVSDRPGAVTTSLLLPYLNDAARMYEARCATREDIDAAMRLGCGHPRGPLALLDQLGLDIVVSALDALHGLTGDRLHAPAPILRQLVSVGWTGVAAGRGLFSYDSAGGLLADELTPSGRAVAAEPREVRAIGVVGTGTMATGIVEVCARSGYDVVFRSRTDSKVAGAFGSIVSSLDEAVSRGELDAPARADTVGRISGTTELTGLAHCDLVIEAVVEDLAVKQRLLLELDRVLKPGAILATITSSLPVIEIGRVTSRPSDVVGMHWFNPAIRRKLVEVVPTARTADDVVATVLEVCLRTGKHPVLCSDVAGFIVNALLFPFLNDAVRAYESGIASQDEIDAAITAATGFPMGPFAVIDVIGVDMTLAIQQTLHAVSRHPGHAPAPSLRYLVAAGGLGRKSKRGKASAECAPTIKMK